MAGLEQGAAPPVLVRCGASISATASAHGTVERRNYPASFGSNYKSGGFEVVRAMDLQGHAARVQDEAADLGAPLCPEGEHTLILGGSQLCLGSTSPWAIRPSGSGPRPRGGPRRSSFATTDKLGFAYGSEAVN